MEAVVVSWGQVDDTVVERIPFLGDQLVSEGVTGGSWREGQVFCTGSRAQEGLQGVGFALYLFHLRVLHLPKGEDLAMMGWSGGIRVLMVRRG